MQINRIHIITFIFLLALLFTAKRSCAQEDTPVMDTVISTVTATQDTASSFDRLDDKTSAVQTRTIPDSVLDKLHRDDDYWYANTIPDRQKKKDALKPKGESLFEKDWFANLVWFLIVGSFVAILIWFLASSNIQLFRRRAVVIEDQEEVLSEEDIFNLNYEKEIQKAVAAQNYRLAVRLWYLRILKEMADKNLIQYKHEKTNQDYLNQLYESAYYRDFFRLTRDFEYTWYGKFDLSAEAYTLIQNDFSAFKHQLPQ
jgi:hypothetical protein